MHDIILEDDGRPDLIKDFREIRFNMKDVDFANYEGLLFANQVQPKNIIVRKAKTFK